MGSGRPQCRVAGIGSVAAPAGAAAANGRGGRWRSSGPPRTLDPMFGLYVRVVAATGMRRGEACGLRWSDVDLDGGRARRCSAATSRCRARSAITRPRPARCAPSRSTPTRWRRSTTAWRAARQLARFAGVDDDTRRAGYVFSFDADGASAWRGDTVSARWIRTRRAAGVDRRSSARSAPLAGDPAARRRRARPDRGRPARSRGRHDDDEDLRPPHDRGDEQAAEVVGAALAVPAGEVERLIRPRMVV